MTASFSWRHKEHLFVILEYAFAFRKTSHVRVVVTFFLFFHFPYITWKDSTVTITFVFKRFYMVIIPLFFKLSFSQSKVYFFRVTGCRCTFVYHTFLSTIAIEETGCLNSTVTIKSLLCFFLNNLFVMSFDYFWHVLSTTIPKTYTQNYTQDISQIIKGHNKKIVQKEAQETLDCNFRVKTDCPLNSDCRKESLLYKCTATTCDSKKVCLGLTEGEFKK